MKKRYTFVLNFGYVESEMLSFMPWTSENTHKDAKEALVDLATFLKEQYLAKNDTPPKKCCVTTKTKDAAAEYCSKCGHSLAEAQFDSEDFSDWIRGLNTDTDTFHGLIEWDPSYRWQSNGLEDAPNPRFVYQAEWVLSAALGYPNHEDVTFETICKNRTKYRKESFSYYR